MCHKSDRKNMPHSQYKFNTSFCCRQQPKGETMHMSGYYAMVLMDDYVRAGPLLRSDSMLQKWSEENEKEVKLAHFWTEHERLQRVLTNIINRHVVRDEGMFYCGAESQEERDMRMKHQHGDIHAPF
jgi:hypothetical protein